MRQFDKWRESYLSSKSQTIKHAFDENEQVSKDSVREKLFASLAEDEVYCEMSTRFYLLFDEFLTECEVNFFFFLPFFSFFFFFFFFLFSFFFFSFSF